MSLVIPGEMTIPGTADCKQRLEIVWHCGLGLPFEDRIVAS